MVFSKYLATSWFKNNDDVVCREITCGAKTVCVFFVSSMIDKSLLAQTVLKPISDLKSASFKNIKQAIFCPEISDIENKKDFISSLLSGSALVFVNNSKKAISINLADFNVRSITEPPTSQVTKGPREGFVEDLNTNLSMVRRRLKSPNLAVKKLVVGRHTKTNVCVVYLDNIADKKLVKVLQDKISKIDIDGIIDSYYIETILEEGKLKFLRRIGNSEKPDVISSRLLEGRIAIFVDGSPIVLTLPFLLIEDLQSPEDYYQISARTTFLRIVRLIGLILGVLLPGIYVALQSYQYRVLPMVFLVTLLSNIEGISLPPILEILFVLFLFDILAEASARMPKLLGMALSIIGALVLGETTVQAGIISPPSIVVVAISSIMLFIIPDDVPQVSLLRILFTIVGGVAGFYGMLMSFIMASTYLVSADGYGVPLLSPYAPTNKIDKHDAIIKKPLLDLKTRPTVFQKKNITRIGGKKHE
ncbi:MAG: spore germination protein [Clostridia bacterium]|nr:spore germination protein [Clostridia bacterium]